MPLIDPTLLLRVNNTRHAIRTPFEMQRLRESEYRFLTSRGPPSPVSLLALDQVHVEGRGGSKFLTILKLFSSSLICWARRGVNRLHVAMSPRRSYSPLGHVSWNWIRGLNTRLFGITACGVIGALFDSEVWNRPSER